MISNCKTVSLFSDVQNRQKNFKSPGSSDVRNNKVIHKLLKILRYDAPGLGLTVHQWGFIRIDDILKLELDELDGMTPDSMIQCIEEFSKDDVSRKDMFTIRRDPKQPAQILVRAKKGQTFVIPPGDGFQQKTTDESRLARTLSYLLRHKAAAEITRDPYGFVEMDLIMAQSHMKGFTEAQVLDLVEKQKTYGIIRFKIRVNETTNKSEIRATFGHTVDVLSMELYPIVNSDVYSTIIYGTNFESWDEIKYWGITRTTKSHIHFATNADRLMSLRFIYYSTSQLLDVLIYIDVKKAIEHGLKFSMSDNHVIICRGDHEVIFDPRYFLRAINVATGKDITL